MLGANGPGHAAELTCFAKHHVGANPGGRYAARKRRLSHGATVGVFSSSWPQGFGVIQFVGRAPDAPSSASESRANGG